MAAKRLVALTFVALASATPTPAQAQNLIEFTAELDFDRPESWAMKYFASLALLTGMGVPERLGAGGITLGFEGGFVPQLDEDERRVGFEGTKVEDLNKTSFFGRPRARIGLGDDYSLELAYVPPIDVGGVKPNLFAAAVGRPFDVSENVQLGLRGYAQFGTIEGDITCGAEEAAAGADPAANPFRCMEPSNDELTQRIFGVELVAGLVPAGPWRPHVGVALNFLDLEFQVRARYSGLDDRTRNLTDGTTVSFNGGVTYVASERFRLTGELFYAPLSVVRPPSTSSQNDGLLNGRFLVTYRLR